MSPRRPVAQLDLFGLGAGEDARPVAPGPVEAPAAAPTPSVPTALDPPPVRPASEPEAEPEATPESVDAGAGAAPARSDNLPVDLADHQTTARWPHLSTPPRVAVVRAATAIAEVAGWSGAWSRLLGIWWCSLNRLGPDHEANEAEYLRLVAGLPREALEAAKAGLEALVRHFFVHGGYCDILGPAHMEAISRTRQAGTGQFFTPWALCLCMARMAQIPDTPRRPDGEAWTVHEPAVGSGANVLAWLGLYAERHGRLAASINVQIGAQDIDADCVLMTRIQLRLVDWFAMEALVATASLPPAKARHVVQLATAVGLPCAEVVALMNTPMAPEEAPSEVPLEPPGEGRAAGEMRAG